MDVEVRVPADQGVEGPADLGEPLAEHLLALGELEPQPDPVVPVLGQDGVHVGPLVELLPVPGQEGEGEPHQVEVHERPHGEPTVVLDGPEDGDRHGMLAAHPPGRLLDLLGLAELLRGLEAAEGQFHHPGRGGGPVT
jgi:hypothetical protein